MGRGCDDFGARWRQFAQAIAPGVTVLDTLFVSGNASPGRWRAVLLLRDTAGRVLPDSLRMSNLFQVR